MKNTPEGSERERQQAERIASEVVGWFCMVMSLILIFCGFIIGVPELVLPLFLAVIIHDLIDKVTNPKKCSKSSNPANPL